MLLKAFGLGIIQGWLWLFFLNGPLLYNSIIKFGNRPETVFMAFMLFTSVSFLFIAKMSKTISRLKKRPLFLILLVSLMGAGTLIVGFEAKNLQVFTYRLVILTGTFMSGFGSAMLISIWGDRFSTLRSNLAALAFGVSVTTGTVIFFALSRLPLVLAVIGTAFLPVFSLILLLHETSTAPILEDTLPNRLPVSCPIPSRLVLFVILFYLAGGLMHKMIAAGQQLGSYETYWLTNIVYFVVCLIAGGIIYAYPGLDLRLLYQPILPLLGAGFVLFPVLHTSYPVIPFSFLQAGFALFDLYTWILFAYLAARHRFPVSVIAWGMLLITLTIFTGELLYTSIFKEITVTIQETNLISLLAALLMFAGTMAFKGQRETFAGWDLPKTSIDNSVVEEIACTHNYETGHSLFTDEVHLPEQFAQQYNLTPREKQIVLLLIEGRNNPYIRENLNISNNTLKTHLRNIYSKLSINARQQLLDLYNNFKEGFSKDKTVRH